MAKKQNTKAKKKIVAKKVSIPAKKKIAPAKKPSITAKKAVKPIKKNNVPVKKVIVPTKKTDSPSKKAAAPVKAMKPPVKKVKVPVKKANEIIRTAPVHPANRLDSTPRKAYTGPKKIKYQTEIEIHASPKILFPYLSTSSGLSEWFAKKVNESAGEFTFSWDGSQKKARLVSKRENQSVKFHWIDDPDETFFEIEIIQDDITSDVALLITDFCLPGEREEDSLLWESQIHDLMHVVG